ncbi:hypothetical protein [Paenibacillus hexagrammi]|uniref:Uncharacterized protein n=1 Tax=Paenibacillus hexagrammi TaxID=2908839 RepID=A0ABY3SCR9_9BACL|nr:hypothetical protein [Paenibacillus sp. YPD9-1]UJF31748.1 hypothetical protein L0M14_18460 [Paenibacillus sp. YPD9-1]
MKIRIKRWISLAFVFTMILQTSIGAADVTANAAEAKGPQNQISDQGSYVSNETNGNDFALVANESAANLYVDNHDSVSVKRAVNDFKNDIKNVTNVDAQVVNTIPNNGDVVIFGTIGSSEAIDTLISNHKLEVSELKKAMEAINGKAFSLMLLNIHSRELIKH